MNLRTIVLILILLALLLFAALNWGVVTTPATLNLAFGQIDAPLGILMLLALAGLTLVYMLLLAKAEAAALLEIRRQTKELEKARKLADRAEESRFGDLRQWLADELGAIQRQLDALVEARSVKSGRDPTSETRGGNGP
jgi:uncharacterized integral membrane protein